MYILFTHLTEKWDQYTYSYDAATYKHLQIIFFSYFKRV